MDLERTVGIFEDVRRAANAIVVGVTVLTVSVRIIRKEEWTYNTLRLLV